MKTNYILLIAAAFSLVGCAGGNATAHSHSESCAHSTEKAEGEAADEIVFSPAQAEAAGVQTETVTPQPFQSALRVSGTIQPSRASMVSVVAPSSGIISSSDIYVGSTINAKAVLATISARAMAEGDPAEKARIEYNAALKEYQRAESLVGDNIVSQKEFERITAQYLTAKAKYEALGSDSGSGVRVTAPVGGRITSCDVANGDYVTAGQRLFTVSSTNRMSLTADVPVASYSLLGEVRSANFKVPSSERTYNISDLGGSLKAIGSMAEASAYIPVTFCFNTTDDIPSGTYAEVYILTGTRDNVISVPTTALTEEQGIYYVYLRLDEECYRKQEVRLGQTDGRRTEVMSGLKQGESVVTCGVYQVKLAAVSSIIPEGHTHNH